MTNEQINYRLAVALGLPLRVEPAQVAYNVPARVFVTMGSDPDVRWNPSADPLQAFRLIEATPGIVVTERGASWSNGKFGPEGRRCRYAGLTQRPLTESVALAVLFSLGGLNIELPECLK